MRFVRQCFDCPGEREGLIPFRSPGQFYWESVCAGSEAINSFEKDT